MKSGGLAENEFVESKATEAGVNRCLYSHMYGADEKSIRHCNACSGERSASRISSLRTNHHRCPEIIAGLS